MFFLFLFQNDEDKIVSFEDSEGKIIRENQKRREIVRNKPEYNINDFI